MLTWAARLHRWSPVRRALVPARGVAACGGCFSALSSLLESVYGEAQCPMTFWRPSFVTRNTSAPPSARGSARAGRGRLFRGGIEAQPVLEPAGPTSPRLTTDCHSFCHSLRRLGPKPCAGNGPVDVAVVMNNTRQGLCIAVGSAVSRPGLAATDRGGAVPCGVISRRRAIIVEAVPVKGTARWSR